MLENISDKGKFLGDFGCSSVSVVFRTFGSGLLPGRDRNEILKDLYGPDDNQTRSISRSLIYVRV